MRYSQPYKNRGGWKLLHSWGVVINSKAQIGENFSIMTGALVGASPHGVPRIGNDVFVGAHAIVLGDIVIGDNVQIGAGAIVTHDVPDNAVIVGDAAHILKYNTGEEKRDELPTSVVK